MGFKPISISLSPNVEKDDISLVLRLIFKPWKWKRGKDTEQIENEFKKYLGVKYAFSFNSGRTSFLAILKSLGIEGDVLLQAFTCNAAVNPVIWAGLNPVYVDCDSDDFNIDINDLEKKITSKTKVLMVQHTFGMPADMDRILDIVKKNNLILIEDCAHSLGAEYNEKKVGTFAKASFFSFSRDKIISSIYGGIVVTNDDELAKKIKDFQERIGYPSYFWIFQQLLHPILMNYIIFPIYNFIDLGKIILVLSQWLGILSKAVHWKEKRGEMPYYFPKRLPNAMAGMALNQFKKLERFNDHRKEIANYYYLNLKGFDLPVVFPNRKNVFLRFTIKHNNAHKIIWQAWNKENILIGDWYTTPIAPYDTKIEKVRYRKGSCLKAEELAQKTFNLPTHINIGVGEAKRIVDFLKKSL